MNPDGYALMLIGLGGTIAATQVPATTPAMTEEMMIERLMSWDTLAYIAVVLMIVVARKRYLVHLRNMLTDFYARSVENYHNLRGGTGAQEEIEQLDLERLDSLADTCSQCSGYSG